jgi:hypothetical protein
MQIINNLRQILFYLPTDAQLNCLKNNFKIYIKIATTYFGVITINIRERKLVNKKDFDSIKMHGTYVKIT